METSERYNTFVSRETRKENKMNSELLVCKVHGKAGSPIETDGIRRASWL